MSGERRLVARQCLAKVIVANIRCRRASVLSEADRLSCVVAGIARWLSFLRPGELSRSAWGWDAVAMPDDQRVDYEIAGAQP